MIDLISGRVERIIRIAVGLYLGLKALTDLKGSVLVLPGIVPMEAPRGLQLFTGCVVVLAVALMLHRKSTKLGAVLLLVTYVTRSFWDIAGGDRFSLAWGLTLPALSIIFWWRPQGPGRLADGKHGTGD